MRIGLDFDNTIIRYDDVFREAAIERGLVSPNFSGTKQQVRNTIRLLSDGEHQWQALQGYVYGKGIQGATLFAGLDDFFRRARVHGDTILIVSHKTEHGHFDPNRVSLRGAAMQWMEGQGFFAEQGFSLVPDNIHFASSRSEKLSRIGDLACDVFIDDLEEVLADPEFPNFVRRILLSEHADRSDDLPYEICRDWASIQEIVFFDRK